MASPDGKSFFFSAFSADRGDDGERLAAIFKVAAQEGATAELLALGEPLRSPIGLVMSCDGDTLFIADTGDESGAVLSLSTAAGSTVTNLGATGMFQPGGLAMAPDCRTLHVTARTDDGRGGLFSLPTQGGSATQIYAGDPLVSPTGVHVDGDGVSWVMDHLAAGEGGEGVLWAVSADGSRVDEVASDLRMGTPGGVSLTAGGGTAVMPTVDADGKAQLTFANIASGSIEQLAAPDLGDPRGLRTARSAGVFAVVGNDSIFLAR